MTLQTMYVDGQDYGCALVSAAYVGVYDRHGSGDGELSNPTALAALPNDGYLVADAGNQRVQQLVSWHAKLAWMRACVNCIV